MYYCSGDLMNLDAYLEEVTENVYYFCNLARGTINETVKDIEKDLLQYYFKEACSELKKYVWADVDRYEVMRSLDGLEKYEFYMTDKERKEFWFKEMNELIYKDLYDSLDYLFRVDCQKNKYISPQLFEKVEKLAWDGYYSKKFKNILWDYIEDNFDTCNKAINDIIQSVS